MPQIWTSLGLTGLVNFLRLADWSVIDPPMLFAMLQRLHPELEGRNMTSFVVQDRVAVGIRPSDLDAVLRAREEEAREFVQGGGDIDQFPGQDMLVRTDRFEVVRRVVEDIGATLPVLAKYPGW